MKCDCILNGLKMERICDVHLGLMREAADTEREACAEIAFFYKGLPYDKLLYGVTAGTEIAETIRKHRNIQS